MSQRFFKKKDVLRFRLGSKDDSKSTKCLSDISMTANDQERTQPVLNSATKCKHHFEDTAVEFHPPWVRIIGKVVI